MVRCVGITVLIRAVVLTGIPSKRIATADSIADTMTAITIPMKDRVVCPTNNPLTTKEMSRHSRGDCFESLCRLIFLHNDRRRLGDLTMNMIPQLEEKRSSLRKKYPLFFSGYDLYAAKQKGGITGVYIKPTEIKVLQKWNNIVSLAATDEYTIGLNYDGTLSHTGYKRKDIGKSESGNLAQCVTSWNNIVDIACGKNYLVALKNDGTVVASSPKERSSNETEVSNWNNIVAISCGRTHTVGLRVDSTVVATGDNYDGRCDVSQWSDIIAISAGTHHTLGLRSNGTVVSTIYKYDAKYDHGQANVASWNGIVAIAAGEDFSLGLKADGSLIATSYIVTSDTYMGHLMDETRYTSLASKEDNVADIFSFNDNGVFILRKNGTLSHMGGSDFFKIRMDMVDFRNKIAQIRLFDSYDDFLNPQPKLASSQNIRANEALRIAHEDPRSDYPIINLSKNGSKKDYYASVAEAMKNCQKSLGAIESKKTVLSSGKEGLGLFSVSKKRLIDARISAINMNKQKIEQQFFALQAEYDKRPISMKMIDLPVGGHVRFGSFEQQRNSVRPIQWKVLQKYQDMALLVSVKCLYADIYSSVNNEAWNESSLRKWLNGEFFRTAFTSDEAQDILTVKIRTPDNTNGNITSDKVFCLSIEEVQKYMPKEQDRHTEYTEHAEHNIYSWKDFMSGNPEWYTIDAWWLRSPGLDHSYAACIYRSKVYLQGGKMMPLGIRPAIWVKVNE